MGILSVPGCIMLLPIRSGSLLRIWWGSLGMMLLGYETWLISQGVVRFDEWG